MFRHRWAGHLILSRDIVQAAFAAGQHRHDAAPCGIRDGSENQLLRHNMKPFSFLI